MRSQEGAPLQVKKLIRSMLEVNVELRPNAEDARKSLGSGNELGTSE